MCSHAAMSRMGTALLTHASILRSSTESSESSTAAILAIARGGPTAFCSSPLLTPILRPLRIEKSVAKGALDVGVDVVNRLPGARRALDVDQCEDDVAEH